MWEKNLGKFLNYKLLMAIAKNQFQLQSEIKIVNLQSKNLMRIIPAIDIIDGKCVRLSKGITTPRSFIMKIRLRLQRV
jgi:hypothetical protein